MDVWSFLNKGRDKASNINDKKSIAVGELAEKLLLASVSRSGLVTSKTNGEKGIDREIRVAIDAAFTFYESLDELFPQTQEQEK